MFNSVLTQGLLAKSLSNEECRRMSSDIVGCRRVSSGVVGCRRNTLSLSNTAIDNAIARSDEVSVVSADKRGCLFNKESHDSIVNHMKMSPTMESHYLCEQTSKLYLGSD